jgi:ABC-type multidrug transport system ATPase subunit
MNEFRFSDISFSVNGNGARKQILQNISGSVRAGETLGILGPSGAGKTSLLNVLTLNALSGDSTGLCTLNQTNMTNTVFQDHCCVVTQEDSHRAFLTARETVRYAANFYLKGEGEEKDKQVDSLLKKLGLGDCADTRVGNQFLPGLSGGQKKRLSVAVALLKRPSLMLLDEPTSGLDAAASYHVMQHVKVLAKDFGICVVCTIHQPSSTIYKQFDKVMLLSQGRCAFSGSPQRSVEYFGCKGYTVPQLSNPAEYLLDIINHEFTDVSQVCAILDEWDKSAEKEQEQQEEQSKHQEIKTCLPEMKQEHDISFKEEFKFIAQRQIRIILTDPMIYGGRAFMFLMACTFFAIIYVESRDRKQEQILNRLWLCMWMVGVPTSLGVIAVYAFNEENKTIVKEVKNGMYSMNAFLAAAFVLQIPVMFVLALFAVGIPGFAIGNFYAPNFLPIIAVYTCILFTYESIARCFSVAFENPLLGMLNFMQVWFTSFLFAGVMIPESMVIWPFRIFCYIMPLKWGIGSIAWLDADESTYSGAYLCDPDIRSDCLMHYEDGQGITPGWSCSSTEGGAYNPLQCYGHSGEQVLESLGMNYDVVSKDDNIARNFGIIVAIAAGFQIVYMVLAVMKCAAVSKIVDLSKGTTPNGTGTGVGTVASEMISMPTV